MNKPEYIILTAQNHVYLEDKVNEKINEGYFPHGSMIVKKDGVNSTLLQPMIIQEKKNSQF